MPIKKSALKAMKRDEKKASRNRARKRVYRGLEKEVTALVAEGKKDDAQKKLTELQKAIGKAQKTGVLKPNTAARKISRFANAINQIK